MIARDLGANNGEFLSRAGFLALPQRSSASPLAAYASGLKVTSSFVIGGTSTVLVLLIGFMVLKEPFSWLKLFSVALIAAGVFLLQRKGPS